MELSRSVFKQLALAGILIFCLLPSHAQDRKKSWLPDHVKLQFAGGTGFFSIGGGYANKNKKLEGDLSYGYVPRSVGGVTIHTLTGKLTWFPVNTIGNEQVQLRPLSCGMLVNYTFGKQYFGFKPDNYPYSYYGHPTNTHLAAFVGGAIDKRVGKGTTKIGLYYELVTFDVELLSYINNKELGITDILSLAIGVKASF